MIFEQFDSKYLEHQSIARTPAEKEAPTAYMQTCTVNAERLCLQHQTPSEYRKRDLRRRRRFHLRLLRPSAAHLSPFHLRRSSPHAAYQSAAAPGRVRYRRQRPRRCRHHSAARALRGLVTRAARREWRSRALHADGPRRGGGAVWWWDVQSVVTAGQAHLLGMSGGRRHTYWGGLMATETPTEDV